MPGRAIAKSKRLSWILYACIVAIVILILIVVNDNSQHNAKENKLSGQQHDDLVCVVNNYNQLIHSLNINRAESKVWHDALDQLIRTVPTQDTKKFNRALQAYLRASNLYNNALKVNPIPAAPKFTCKSISLGADNSIIIQPSTSYIPVTVTPSPSVSTQIKIKVKKVVIPGTNRTVFRTTTTTTTVSASPAPHKHKRHHTPTSSCLATVSGTGICVK